MVGKAPRRSVLRRANARAAADKPGAWKSSRNYGAGAPYDQNEAPQDSSQPKWRVNAAGTGEDDPIRGKSWGKGGGSGKGSGWGQGGGYAKGSGSGEDNKSFSIKTYRGHVEPVRRNALYLVTKVPKLGDPDAMRRRHLHILDEVRRTHPEIEGQVAAIDLITTKHCDPLRPDNEAATGDWPDGRIYANKKAASLVRWMERVIKNREDAADELAETAAAQNTPPTTPSGRPSPLGSYSAVARSGNFTPEPVKVGALAQEFSFVDAKYHYEICDFANKYSDVRFRTLAGTAAQRDDYSYLLSTSDLWKCREDVTAAEAVPNTGPYIDPRNPNNNSIDAWDFRLKCINSISVHGGNLAGDLLLVDYIQFLTLRHDRERAGFFEAAFPVFYFGLTPKPARWLVDGAKITSPVPNVDTMSPIEQETGLHPPMHQGEFLKKIVDFINHVAGYHDFMIEDFYRRISREHGSFNKRPIEQERENAKNQLKLPLLSFTQYIREDLYENRDTESALSKKGYVKLKWREVRELKRRALDIYNVLDTIDSYKYWKGLFQHPGFNRIWDPARPLMMRPEVEFAISN